MVSLALSLLFSSPAVAAESDVDGEVIVYGDPFRRWDGTRWAITTEMVLPSPMTLAKNENVAFRTMAMQLRGVLLCELDGSLGKRKMEINCTIESVGLQAAAIEKKHLRVGEVLDEIDDKLSGARLQMQVSADGRVTNVDLEGVAEARNARERAIQETLRMVVYRLVVGYDLKLRKGGLVFQERQWTEYHSPLMTMPSSTRSTGTSLVVHQMHDYRGYWTVQTKGSGLLKEGDLSLQAKLDGVTIFDKELGFLTERVWTLRARSTGAMLFNRTYWHSGRVQMLGRTQAWDVGPTRQVAPPNETQEGLANWVFFELDS